MNQPRREVLGALTAVAGSMLLPSPSTASAPAQAAAAGREAVTGIGGFFFRAHDPEALARWYQEHLGIGTAPQKPGDKPWTQQAGTTAFTPFPETTKYFGDPARQWMMNFRVRDLDRMAAQLEAAGVTVKVDPTAYPYGRFAHLHDPEGNPIELWQPAESAAKA